MDKFTLLSESHLFGSDESKKLEVLKKYGAKASITDFAILLGGYVSLKEKNNIGNYWILSCDNYDTCAIRVNGTMIFENNYKWRSVRPIILKPDVSKILIKETINGISEVEYNGYEYPQTAVEKMLSTTLEKKYNKGILKKTGKTYTIILTEKYDAKTSEELEYEYNGKRYVRIKACFYETNLKTILSNKEVYSRGDYVWIEVEPIRWLLDNKTGVLISKNLLFSGLSFYSELEKEITPLFEKTILYKYINTVFAKDIISKKSIVEKEVEIPMETVKKEENHFNFIFDNKNDTEQLIKDLLKSGISLVLYSVENIKIEGAARAKALDPDCVIVDLKTINESSLIGMIATDFEKKETMFIKPWWYKEICEKCDRNPGKIHILFFDAETEDENIPLTLKKLAHGIIANKKIINSAFECPLPENCRIILSVKGLSYNDIAEKISLGIVSIGVNSTMSNYLQWSLTLGSNSKLKIEEEDNKIKEFTIHPVICAYMAYKGDKLLSCLDYKKLEIASKILYKTKNPYTLGIVFGYKIAQEFCWFCNQETTSLKDILEGKHIEFTTLSEKYLTVTALSEVNEEDVEIVRNFVKDMGVEFENLFDSLWTYDNPKRLEIIERLKEEQNVRSLNK